MAQTGFTPISIYYSATATNVPTAGNLVAGELAINTADGKLYYKDSSGVVQTIASKAGALGDVVGPASATDNAVSRFDLTTGKLIQNSLVTISDTGAISAPVDASISGLTVGKGGGAVASNMAIGFQAINASATGTANTAVGYQTGFAITSGTQNTFTGYVSGKATTTGSDNVANGYASLFANSTGASNTALGTSALQSNTTASNNTAVGYQAGYSNTTGVNNFYGATYAGQAGTTASYNVAIGGPDG
jgi:hypothetical protein